MSWAKFDDRFPSHKKIMRLSAEAFRLFVTAVCFACEHGTNGAVDRAILQGLPNVPRGAKLRSVITELEESGCWEKTDVGWQIHDFLQWNPDAETVEAQRGKRSASGKLGGMRSAESKANAKQLAKQTLEQTAGKTEAGSQAESNPVPVPPSLSGPPSGVSSVSSQTPDLTRVRGARPVPRRVLLAIRVEACDYVPLPAHWAYAEDLGLTADEFEAALRELRDKHGNRRHDEAWLDDKFSAFLEQAAKTKQAGPRRSAGGGFESPAERRTREQLDRVAMLERQEREAAQAGAVQ